MDISYLWQPQTIVVCDNIKCIYNDKGMSQAERLRREQELLKISMPQQATTAQGIPPAPEEAPEAPEAPK